MSRQPASFITIQYLRGLAALLVVWLHATTMTVFADKGFWHFGRAGVDIFFVISGFIMWTATANAPRSPTAFWRLRILRVVPLYWFFTLVFVAALLIDRTAVFNARSIDMVFLIRSLFFVPTVDPSIGTTTPMLAPGWTLNFEMFFYFVFGASLLLSNLRLRAAAVLGIFIGLNIAGHVVRIDSPIWSFYTNPMLLEFCLGLLIALNVQRIASMPTWLGALFILLAGGLFVINSIRSPDGADIFSGFGAGLIVTGCLAFERFASRRALPIAKFLGDASYSIYLAHPFAQRAVFLVVAKAMGSAILLEWYRSYIAFAFIVGAIGGSITYVLIEKPFLRMAKSTLLKKRNDRPPPHEIPQAAE
jgi:peptidoglycan/LPS O-acetylase OafA/YrhL